MILNENSQKLKLDYPCSWEYKLVIQAHHDIGPIVKEVLQQREHSIQKSQQSKGGKYTSYSLSVLVHCDDDRKALFEILKSHQSIKFVL
ncbi:MAG: DUF493 domain-containing protein [Sulfurospirillaceae bacterium]|nr:DUF493 domain-containing protein [Sulfurospirillaceae bacterium]